MDTADHQPAMPRRLRRWLSYSLRSLLIVTALGTIVLGFWVITANRQRWAVAEIKVAYGHVVYDAEPARFAHVAVWLSEWLGPDYFADVVGVDLEPSTTVDRLAHLRGLTKLEMLKLDNCNISDAKFWELGTLTNLEWLSLHGARVNKALVNDVKLRDLRTLSNLEWLDLRNTPVSDVGLLSLRRLTNLKLLDLRGTEVTDAGCEQLRRTLPGCWVKNGPEQ